MKVCIVGTGYVGLVTGACLAETGNDVICADVDAAKIARLRAGEVPSYEPGLEPLIERNGKAGRIVFSDDVASAIAQAQVAFIAVGTPQRTDGAVTFARSMRWRKPSRQTSTASSWSC